MTKTVIDNVTGEQIDADDSVELQMTDRSDGRLRKVEFDMSRASWLELLKTMVKKPKYQQWIKHDEQEKKETGKTGHWEKIEGLTDKQLNTAIKR